MLKRVGGWFEGGESGKGKPTPNSFWNQSSFEEQQETGNFFIFSHDLNSWTHLHYTPLPAEQQKGTICACNLAVDFPDQPKHDSAQVRVQLDISDPNTNKVMFG